jgi:thioredoxin 1
MQRKHAQLHTQPHTQQPHTQQLKPHSQQQQQHAQQKPLEPLILKPLEKKVITVIESRQKFFELLQFNPGIFIIKFGASWCGPCKKIAHIVDAFFGKSPDHVMCADVDVDVSHDLYSFLKSKKMVNGIPTILCYKKGNHSFIPDDSVLGIQPNELFHFFKRCEELASIR